MIDITPEISRAVDQWRCGVFEEDPLRARYALQHLAFLVDMQQLARHGAKCYGA